MRHIFCLFVSIIAFSAMPLAAEAQPETLEVTVSYRERIALPPDAELDVQLLDVSRTDAVVRRIASQRFAMRGVPMTVTLSYDRQIIDAQASYAVVAAIWSGDDQLFRAIKRSNAFGSEGAGPVDIVLAMVVRDDGITAPPRLISGIEWAVTEVAGTVWSNDDPATLLIDGAMNFSIFGGCNRFGGQLTLSDGAIAFPQDFAGTLMACPDEIEALERSFLDVLARVSGYVRYGAGLVMTDADGNALLHFTERPE